MLQYRLATDTREVFVCTQDPIEIARTMSYTKNLIDASPWERRALNRLLQDTKQVSLTESLGKMSTSERMERARRVDYKLKDWFPGMCPLVGRNNASMELKANHGYYQCYKATNMSKFCNGAVTIRQSHQNYEEWKQYTSKPCMSIPSSLKLLTNDLEVIFGLALLEKIKLISLEPNTLFISGNTNENSVLFEDLTSTTDIEELLVLWESLGRPRMHFLENVNLIDEAYNAHFASKGKPEPPSISEEIGPRPLDSYEIRKLVWEVCLFLATDCYVPIKPDYYTTSFKLNFDEFIHHISLSIAFDSLETDTLGAIYKLFPTHPELLPRIIREYRVLAVDPPFGDDPFLVKMRDVNRKAFNCKTLYEKCKYRGCFYRDESPRHGIYHSGALLQIQKHPHLFQDWKQDSQMQPIYWDVVEPALRANISSALSRKL